MSASSSSSESGSAPESSVRPLHPDEQHLQLLVIFHFVLAPLLAMSSCFPAIHMISGIMILVEYWQDSQAPEVTPETGELIAGMVLTLIPALLITFGWLLAFALLLTGYCIRQRRWYRFCLITEGLACFLPPFGTGLGALGLIVLLRPSIKARFAAR